MLENMRSAALCPRGSWIESASLLALVEVDLSMKSTTPVKML